MNVIFDMFYTIFPLIVVSQETPSFAVALGYLQTDDELIIYYPTIYIQNICKICNFVYQTVSFMSQKIPNK